MSVATMESHDLLWETTGARVQLAVARVQLAVARVQLAVARGFLGILGLGVCMNLIRLHCRLDKVGRIITVRDVHTDADRRVLRKFAQFHQRIADAMSSHRDWIADKQQPPFFKFAIVHLLDALVVQAEDIAETAALGASVEFANLVEEDLKGPLRSQT